MKTGMRMGWLMSGMAVMLLGCEESSSRHHDQSVEVWSDHTGFVRSYVDGVCDGTIVPKRAVMRDLKRSLDERGIEEVGIMFSRIGSTTTEFIGEVDDKGDRSVRAAYEFRLPDGIREPANIRARKLAGWTSGPGEASEPDLQQGE